MQVSWRGTGIESEVELGHKLVSDYSRGRVERRCNILEREVKG